MHRSVWLVQRCTATFMGMTRTVAYWYMDLPNGDRVYRSDSKAFYFPANPDCRQEWLEKQQTTRFRVVRKR